MTASRGGEPPMGREVVHGYRLATPRNRWPSPSRRNRRPGSPVHAISNRRPAHGRRSCRSCRRVLSVSVLCMNGTSPATWVSPRGKLATSASHLFTRLSSSKRRGQVTTGSSTDTPRRWLSSSAKRWMEQTPPFFEHGGWLGWKGHAGGSVPASPSACLAKATRWAAVSDVKSRPYHSAIPYRVFNSSGIGRIAG